MIIKTSNGCIFNVKEVVRAGVVRKVVRKFGKEESGDCAFAVKYQSILSDGTSCLIWGDLYDAAEEAEAEMMRFVDRMILGEELIKKL